MDKIFLNGMKAQTLIGVYEWERNLPQTVLLDLVIGLPNRCTNDDIVNTIHYGQVCERVRQALLQQQFQLIESLAEFVAQFILNNFQAPYVRVRITKLGILPDVREVAIEIEREAV